MPLPRFSTSAADVQRMNKILDSRAFLLAKAVLEQHQHRARYRAEVLARRRTVQTVTPQE